MEEHHRSTQLLVSFPDPQTVLRGVWARDYTQLLATVALYKVRCTYTLPLSKQKCCSVLTCTSRNSHQESGDHGWEETEESDERPHPTLRYLVSLQVDGEIEAYNPNPQWRYKRPPTRPKTNSRKVPPSKRFSNTFTLTHTEQTLHTRTHTHDLVLLWWHLTKHP